MDNAGFVTRLYDDAFGRDAAAEEVGYWTQRLERGELGRRDVALAFAEALEGQAAFQQLATDGFLFA